MVCIFILSSGSLFSIDLETKKSKLEIDFLIVPGFSVYSETTYSWGVMFDLKKAEISFKGENDDISFRIETDFSEFINTPTPVLSDILNDCYFQYKFFKELKIRVGNFKWWDTRTNFNSFEEEVEYIRQWISDRYTFLMDQYD